jgi:NAD(P)-dependent dehydrogenase (short-subunit alcohol dehydrogenase family)
VNETGWGYEGKVAIVTGATAGIGNAIARRLIASGARVTAAARSLEALSEMNHEFGERLHTIATDVTQATNVEWMVRGTVERFGRLDVAFNVAGGARAGTIAGMSDEDWDYTNDLCYRSIFLCMKHEARQMIEQGTGGAIVNVSSVNSLVPFPGASAYSSAKAGVDMLTKNAAVELAEHNIRVNALLPGLVATRLTEPLTKVREINDAYMSRIPMRRSADSFEMTGPALFLGSSEASYVTGACLIADGGWTLSGYPDLRQWISPG